MKFVYCFASILLFTSCWPTSVSLVDSGSMPPEWKTFTLKTLELEAPNAPNNLASVLSENIKDGIQNNTRLLLNPKNGEGEILIEGKITNYTAVPIAIQQGDEAAKNRLTITANFTIFIKKPKEDKMALTSSQFIDFDPVTTDFTSNEISLYEEINKKIVQDVINKLLSNW
ncbi:MAG: LptE family protein [Flavobacteriia bacterium]|nr:LptE family protein [Flavobacteriia bacterium]